MSVNSSRIMMRNQAASSRCPGAWPILVASIVAALLFVTPGSVFSQKKSPEEDGKYAIILEGRQFTPAAGIAKKDLAELQSLLKKKKTPHVIAQLKTAVNQQEMEQLRKIGLRLQTPVGGYAWFAVLSSKKPLYFTNPKTAKSSPLSLIRWIGRISPEDKIDPYLKSKGPGSWAKASDGRVKISVTFHQDISPKTARSILSKYKASIESKRTHGHGFFIVIDPALINTLANVDEIRSIGTYPPPKIPFNNRSRAFTNTDVVQADGLSGQGVILGIWDGNEVDVAHRDLAGRVTFGETPRTGITSEHSTHVACTMMGSGAVTANLRGHAPQASIVSFDYNGNPADEMVDALRDHQIVAANNSWGYVVGWQWDGVRWQFFDNQDFFGRYVFSSDFDALVRGSNLVVVFAAGNDRDDGPPPPPPGAPPPPPSDWDQGTGKGGYDTLPPPGSAKNIITVGATDAAGNMSVFSSWGPTDDGRIKPDLVADGVGISSCDDDANNHSATLSDLNDRYVPKRGTSMAAPAVTGITALLLEAYRDSYLGGQSGPAPLPSTVKAVLVQSARDLGVNRGPDYVFGWGGIDAQGAVDLIRNHRVVEETISQAEMDTFEVFVPPGATELRVTLAWDDPPGRALLNDLDLVLRDPNGNLHYPWTLDPANPAGAAVPGIDRTNNVEQVEVKPITGTWAVIVNGSRAKYLEQSYSVVSNHGFGPVAANFNYAAKFICGESRGPTEALGLPRGRYSTVVNVHNPFDGVAYFTKRVSLAFPPGNQRPGRTVTLGFDALGPGRTLAVDCLDIQRRAFPGGFAGSYVEGIVAIESELAVDVNTLYTTAPTAGEVMSVDVESIKPRDMRPLGGKLPDLAVVQNPDGSYARLRCESGWDPYACQLLMAVKNQGEVFSSQFDVALTVKNVPWSGRLYSKSVSGLVKDEIVILAFDIRLSWTSGPSGLTIPFEYTITLDKVNIVAEINEANNSVSGEIVSAERF